MVAKRTSTIRVSAKAKQWLEGLTKENPHPEIWENKDENGRPKSEMGYFRADHDGNRWWDTAWSIHKELETPALIKEFDSTLNMFYKALPTLSHMRRFCAESATPVSDTEYNAYLEGAHGVYRFRMRTMSGDYNLYLYAYSKEALAG